MSAKNRGFFKKKLVPRDNRLFDFAEDIGNRKTFDDAKIPADDVGNYLESGSLASLIHDGLGNSLDEEPSHDKSGILAYVTAASKYAGKQKIRPTAMSRPKRNHVEAAPSPEEQAWSSQPKIQAMNIPVLDQPAKRKSDVPHDHMTQLSLEFKKLLHHGQGMPFSFSMKTIRDMNNPSEAAELVGIESIEEIMHAILVQASIEAAISFIRYRTAHHRFVVFLVHPEVRDPKANKVLISALRQIVLLHVEKLNIQDINFLVILSNAQAVIEGQMVKIGAEKIN